MWETQTIKSYGISASRSVMYPVNADGLRSRLQYPQGYQFIYEYTQRNQLANPPGSIRRSSAAITKRRSCITVMS